MRDELLIFGKSLLTTIFSWIRPAFGEPRHARRATKSIGGALRYPRNGFQKSGSDSGAFV
jgi:hypothetical protein